MSTPIERKDIKAGDKIRQTFEYTAPTDGASAAPWTWVDVVVDAAYELIERPVMLPTEPGFYLDKDGDMWKLTGPYPRWRCLGAGTYDYRAAEYAPFTPMRKAPEVAAEVLAMVNGHIEKFVPFTFTLKRAIAEDSEKWMAP